MKKKSIKLTKSNIVLIVTVVVTIAIIVSIIVMHQSEEVSPIVYPSWITQEGQSSLDFTESSSLPVMVQDTQNFANKAFTYFKEDPYFKSYPNLKIQKTVNMYTSEQGIKNANNFCKVANDYYMRIINDMDIATQGKYIPSTAIQVNINKFTQTSIPLETFYPYNQIGMWLDSTYPGYENGGINPPSYDKLLTKVSEAKGKIIFATELTTALKPNSYVINMKDLVAQKRVAHTV